MCCIAVEDSRHESNRYCSVTVIAPRIQFLGGQAPGNDTKIRRFSVQKLERRENWTSENWMSPRPLFELASSEMLLTFCDGKGFGFPKGCLLCNLPNVTARG